MKPNYGSSTLKRVLNSAPMRQIGFHMPAPLQWKVIASLDFRFFEVSMQNFVAEAKFSVIDLSKTLVDIAGLVQVKRSHAPCLWLTNFRNFLPRTTRSRRNPHSSWIVSCARVEHLESMSSLDLKLLVVHIQLHEQRWGKWPSVSHCNAMKRIRN